MNQEYKFLEKICFNELNISNDIVEFLASSVEGNIRELEGILKYNIMSNRT
jgi:chromosomal replication initiation ATPase DnaA